MVVLGPSHAMPDIVLNLDYGSRPRVSMRHTAARMSPSILHIEERSASLGIVLLNQLKYPRPDS